MPDKIKQSHEQGRALWRKFEATEEAAISASTPEIAAPSGAFSGAGGSAPSFISAHDDDLARDMACFLWHCSQLRHGLFTPPEFIPLVSARLREYLTSHAPNDQGQPHPTEHDKTL